jgi:crossover junction endodeoxyribonuclease RusA
MNPNHSKGMHWSSTSKARKDARMESCLIAKQAVKGHVVTTNEIALKLVFVQPDKRRRDRDNLLAAAKPQIDGIADAMGIDDSRFEPVTISREYGAKPGHIRITIGS